MRPEVVGPKDPEGIPAGVCQEFELTNQTVGALYDSDSRAGLSWSSIVDWILFDIPWSNIAILSFLVVPIQVCAPAILFPSPTYPAVGIEWQQANPLVKRIIAPASSHVQYHEPQ